MNSDQIIQSWHEPALHTLGSLLSVRKANLRKINNEFIQPRIVRQLEMRGLVKLSGG